MFLLFPSSCGVVFLFLFFFISGCVLGQFILFEALVYWPQKKELPSDIIFSKLCKLLHESYLLSFSCTLLWYWVSNKRKSFLIKEAIRNFLNKQSFFFFQVQRIFVCSCESCKSRGNTCKEHSLSRTWNGKRSCQRAENRNT